VTLVAVTKTASPGDIRSLSAAGHGDFGENRVDRLEAGASLLPAARWHMIGRLQGNKVRRARPVTALLHSLDRRPLADYWASAPGPCPPVLVQVNVGGDPRKAGISPQDAAGLVGYCVKLGLEVGGLMVMPPLGRSPEDSRPVFRETAALARRLRRAFPGLAEVSMGMTDDFEVAVEEGATILRVGRAIFGPTDEGLG
jgi:pyridoxal phosphate enzyme (YggS family)